MSNTLEGQIGAHRPIDHEPKTGILSSPEAETLLGQKIGLTFTPANYSQIATIACRDGEYTKYLAARTSPTVTTTHQIFYLKEVAVGFVSDVIGQNKDDSITSAEIVKVEVAPVLRGRGLGTVVDCLTRIRHIEEGAEMLKSYESDESGMIGRLNESLGYQKTGKKLPDGYSEEWELAINDQNKDEVLQKLTSKFITTLERIKDGDLDFDPIIVDRDNPARQPVIDAIRGKSEEDLQQTTIYGYEGSPIMITQEPGGVLVMKVKNPDRNVFERFEDAGYKVYPYPTTLIIDGYEIVSPPLKNPAEFRGNIEKLASQAQVLFNQQSKKAA